ncbi:MAG TPA: Ig-like domain-containing protein [Gemmatimonadales bacterium]|nr:Ig-like domain-containing protein [Gemmatimonadales bacterium]
MHHGRGLAALTLVCTAVALATCVYPTERDAAVHVSITPLHVLLRGSAVVRSATAWQVLSATDSQPIPNVRFVWTSSNPLVASVDNSGRITGIRSGTVTITAAAANFDRQARAGKDTVRVSAALEVDSVRGPDPTRPDTVKFGERLSIYGVGVDSIFQASLAGAILIPVPFNNTNYANGTARTRYWVPPPAVTDSVLFFGIFNGNGVFGYVHGDTTRVIERDLYDPNEFAPRRIPLTPPFTQFPALVFWNPALAFEQLPLGAASGADWFRFGFTPPKNLSVIIESPQLAGTFSTFLSDSLGWSPTLKRYIIGHNSWTFGPGSHACHGLAFSPDELTGDSTIVAFKGLTTDSLDAIAVFTQPGRYGLRVIDALVSELPLDHHEDDNSCNAADAQGVRAVPWRDTLAIENPHDIDWIRFTAPSLPLLSSLEFRVHANSGVNPDSTKFLTFYVIKVPAPTDTALTIAYTDTAVASRLDHQVTTTSLTAGADYYAVVLDFAGATTYYEICAQIVGLSSPATCAGAAWPAPPAPSATAGAPRWAPSRAAPTARLGRPLRRGHAPRGAPRLRLGHE